MTARLFRPSVHPVPRQDGPQSAAELLLVHFDGGFSDSSPYHRALTVPSGITNTTGGKFGGGNNCATTTIGSFGTNAGITLATPSGHFDMGTGDFTAEFQIDRGSGGFWTWSPLGCTDWGFSFSGSTGAISFAAAGGVSISYTFAAGGYHHIAGTRSGNTFTLWVDGTSRGTGTSSSSLATGTTLAFCGGRSFDTGTQALKFDEIRIIKGIALYTSNFTPPSAAFPDP